MPPQLRPESANRGVIAGEMHLAPQKYANVCKFVLVFAAHSYATITQIFTEYISHRAILYIY